jgi:hypothetical protein
MSDEAARGKLYVHVLALRHFLHLNQYQYDIQSSPSEYSKGVVTESPEK